MKEVEECRENPKPMQWSGSSLPALEGCGNLHRKSFKANSISLNPSCEPWTPTFSLREKMEEGIRVSNQQAPLKLWKKSSKEQSQAKPYIPHWLGRCLFWCLSVKLHTSNMSKPQEAFDARCWWAPKWTPRTQACFPRRSRRLIGGDKVDPTLAWIPR